MKDRATRSRVLVVDDVPANIRVISEALRAEHQIIAATRAQDALALAAREPRPDLVLLDVVMPEMDGYEVCRQLKADAATRDIPVIFITARDDVEDETRGLELGAVDFITKPFSLAILETRVRTQLELKRCRDLLERLSTVDRLTGVANHRHFEGRLDAEWRRARRVRSPLALAFIDVDRLEAFNAAHGNPTGDQCLKRVAGELDRSLRRASDVLARYDGGTFAALISGTPVDQAVGFANLLRRRIESLGIPHADSPVSDCVTVSIGLASTIPAGGQVATALLEAARRALTRAKRAGRNRVENLWIQ